MATVEENAANALQLATAGVGLVATIGITKIALDATRQAARVPKTRKRQSSSFMMRLI